MKITLKTVWNIFYALVIAVLVLVAGALTVSAFNIPGGFKLYTVQSGSMEPAILTGSIVISQSVSQYRVNDVITYKSKEEITNPNPKVTTTHRIIDTEEIDGKTEFVTKGDANDGRDGGTVRAEQILGKAVFSVPFLGYPVAFARTQMGLIVLIIIPATMIIYSELMNIKNEAVRLLKERKKRKLSMLEKAEVAVGQEVMATEKEIKKVEKELAKDIKDLKKVVKKEEKVAKAKVKKS